MRPENLLSSLVAIYPPEGSKLERAGYLPGERAPVSEKSPQMVCKSAAHLVRATCILIIAVAVFIATLLGRYKCSDRTR